MEISIPKRMRSAFRRRPLKSGLLLGALLIALASVAIRVAPTIATSNATSIARSIARSIGQTVAPSIANVVDTRLATSRESGAPAIARAANDDRVVVDVSRVPRNRAVALARALPEWEEPISSGTERITIRRSEFDGLLAAGFEVSILWVAAELPPWPGCYRTLAAAYQEVEALVEAHPDLLELIDIGDSHCKAAGGCTTPGGDVIPGADIYVVRVTNEESWAEKAGRMWIDGGLHSRELPSVELVIEMLHHLVDGYGDDAQITYLLDHRELYVGIVSNPDGRQLVELGALEPYSAQPWLWRKNGRDEGGDCSWPPTSGSQYGVDLNRNHAFKFDVDGHSKNPCAQTYRGVSPASEPEIQAYADFVRSIFPDQRGPEDTDRAPDDATGFLINFHNATYPGTMLVPWGWTTEKSPNDAELWAIAERYTALNGYRIQYSLYPVSGNTRDWSYGELGIPSYVIELQGDTFVSPCSDLPGIIQQNLQGITAMLNLADRPYERIRGPEVTRVEVAPADRHGGPVISARVTELRAGGSTIVGAEVTLSPAGSAPDGWPLPGPAGTPGAGLPMAAADGAFDGRSEDVIVRVPSADLEPGRYLATVRAVDSDGWWGSVETVWVEIGETRWYDGYLPSVEAWR